MAAVPRYIVQPEATWSVRSSQTAEILRFSRRRLTAVASDPRETYGRDEVSAFTREIAAGWAVTLALAVLVVMLF